MRSLSAALFAGVIAGAFVWSVSAVASAKYQENVVWSFGALPDGQVPRGTLIEVNGKLYGTTGNGGANRGGTVFSLDPSTGVETVLHSFCAPGCIGDGEEPDAGLIDVDGTLYGTTTAGGAYGGGAIFSFDPDSGAEAIVHSFCSEAQCADGAAPRVALVDVKGVLYGTTTEGGPKCRYEAGFICGTVFSFDPKTGVEKLVHSFDKFADGTRPGTSLVYWKGALYGTTYTGGGIRCDGDGPKYGCGVLYSIDPKSGVETVLYEFCSQPYCVDGFAAYSSLININGVFYGTTSTGGGSSQQSDLGTLYSYDPNSGAVKVVYSFCSKERCADGSNPYGNLIDVKGKLYGTTSVGGDANRGTVFSFDPNTGVEKALYSFQSGHDGNMPSAGLTDVGGTFYGTTLYGNAHSDNGTNGTIFSLTK